MAFEIRARDDAETFDSPTPGIAGAAALTHDDSGRPITPETATEWDAWVSAGRTRHFLEDDPLLDWLDRHGRAKGFSPDHEMVGFDPRTDFLSFVSSQGQRFEERVLELIARSLPIVRIGTGWQDAQDLAKAIATLDAMRAGMPVISQAIVRNPENRTYGAVDMLVRSDVLEIIVPGEIAEAERSTGAPGLGSDRWHYRVVDIKFTTLHLLKDGHASPDHRKYMAQVWVYNEALGRIQGTTPKSSYLLGRCWTTSAERGTGCLERMARVDHDRVFKASGVALRDQVEGAISWVRRMRAQGASWDVFPVPSVPELYPHARHGEDHPWHRAKASIASQLAELTLLPGMNPERRRRAHAMGVVRWDDPRTTAEMLNVPEVHARKCDGVLAANRSHDLVPVLPERITAVTGNWRTPAPLELYVDFETVSNLADDFGSLPEIGGQPLIFQVGCGWYERGQWRFWQQTAERLDPESEARVIDAWVGHCRGLLDARKLDLSEMRVVHWSHAESSSLDTAYNAARSRHPASDWPEIPWFDVLERVVRAEPVTVRGAFGFGLKPIAKAMHAAGLITTTWDDGPTDGLGAMVGAWWCDAEAARTDVPMGAIPLMGEIGRYNEVDCRTMAEVLTWLRANR